MARVPASNIIPDSIFSSTGEREDTRHAKLLNSWECYILDIRGALRDEYLRVLVEAESWRLYPWKR